MIVNCNPHASADFEPIHWVWFLLTLLMLTFAAPSCTGFRGLKPSKWSKVSSKTPLSLSAIESAVVLRENSELLLDIERTEEHRKLLPYYPYPPARGVLDRSFSNLQTGISRNGGTDVAISAGVRAYSAAMHEATIRLNSGPSPVLIDYWWQPVLPKASRVLWDLKGCPTLSEYQLYVLSRVTPEWFDAMGVIQPQSDPREKYREYRPIVERTLGELGESIVSPRQQNGWSLEWNEPYLRDVCREFVRDLAKDLEFISRTSVPHLNLPAPGDRAWEKLLTSRSENSQIRSLVDAVVMECITLAKGDETVRPLLSNRIRHLLDSKFDPKGCYSAMLYDPACVMTRHKNSKRSFPASFLYYDLKRSGHCLRTSTVVSDKRFKMVGPDESPEDATLLMWNIGVTGPQLSHREGGSAFSFNGSGKDVVPMRGTLTSFALVTRIPPRQRVLPNCIDDLATYVRWEFGDPETKTMIEGLFDSLSVGASRNVTERWASTCGFRVKERTLGCDEEGRWHPIGEVFEEFYGEKPFWSSDWIELSDEASEANYDRWCDEALRSPTPDVERVVHVCDWGRLASLLPGNGTNPMPLDIARLADWVGVRASRSSQLSLASNVDAVQQVWNWLLQFVESIAFEDAPLREKVDFGYRNLSKHMRIAEPSWIRSARLAEERKAAFDDSERGRCGMQFFQCHGACGSDVNCLYTCMKLAGCTAY